MKAAFSVWDQRIAPVFETAPAFYVVDAATGHTTCETYGQLQEEFPFAKVLRLAALGVDTLVCGAISKPLHDMIVAYGIKVIPWITGDAHEVIEIWLRNDRFTPNHVLPGCGFQAQHRIHGERNKLRKERSAMNGGKGKGGGRGQGRGQGRSGQTGGGRGQGRGGQQVGGRGGGGAIGINEYCVCPQCGQREIHQRPVPCFERQCSRCGAAMTRG